MKSSSGPDCVGNFVAGDLVITEIMANPSGDDTGKEWFEIYNAGRTMVDLTGLTLVASKNDGTGVKTHTMTAAMLAPGAFMALGGVAPNLKPGYINYGFGADLGALRNDNGYLALKCGSTIVDQATYIATTEGKSTELDGTTVPSSVANDTASSWCPAMTLYDGTNAGTPGMANEPCQGGGGTTCMDQGATREIVPPAEGDLVIDEIMADPSKVSDTAGEWFEVAVLADVDLNGLQLGTMDGSYKDTVTAQNCIHMAAGSFALFASAATANGGLPTPTGLFSFGLTNSGGSVAIGYGGQLIDQATYGSATSGTAWQLDPTMLDPAKNDVATAFCKATMTYGDGDKGTPGAANTSCGTIMPMGQCSDGGTMRNIVKPKVGDLIITEVMPDPAKVADSMGEWFEVLAKADVDLNGVGIGAPGATPKATVGGTDCVKATNGTYLVFANNGDMGMNGGLPKVDVAYATAFTLVNSGGTFALSIDGTVIDQATYGSATSGASLQLDPGKLDATSNDTATNFCSTPAGTTYGAGDRGTPGAANLACP